MNDQGNQGMGEERSRAEERAEHGIDKAALSSMPGSEAKEGDGGTSGSDGVGDRVYESYGQWKDRFELTHFKVREPPKPFAEIGSNGNIRYYSASDFKAINQEQPKDFMKKWLEDPDKRMYELRCQAPGPYQKWKNEFEAFSFLSKDRKTITSIRFGYITEYTVKTAMREFNSEFIKLWVSDPTAQRCSGIDWLPPGEEHPSTFNMYKGFSVARMNPIPNNEVMSLVGDLLSKWREMGILDTMVDRLRVLYEDHSTVELPATDFGWRHPVGSLFKFHEPLGLHDAPKNSRPVNNSEMYMPPMIKLVKGGIVPSDIEIPGFTGNGYDGGDSGVARALYQYVMAAKLEFNSERREIVVVHPEF